MRLGWTRRATTGTQSFNPKTCLLTINFHGTYQLTGGTGAYQGITGSGNYKLGILAIGAKSGGKCSKSLPPVAFHQVINVTKASCLASVAKYSQVFSS